MAGEMEQIAQSPIGKLIKEGDYRTLHYTLEHSKNRKYEMKFTDRKGNTYLHYLCTAYSPYVIHALMKFGVNINAQNKYGNTALHVSALHGECCHVPDLMVCGIDPLIHNQDGKTAADLAKDNKRWLDLYNKYMPTLRGAIKARNMDDIYYLLHSWSSLHYCVDGRDMRRYAAGLTFHDLVTVVDKHRFHMMVVYAVFELDYKSLEYALTRGPAVNVNYLQELRGSHPHHILQHAIRMGETRMVQMLVDAGADVNTTVHIHEYVRGPLYFEVLCSNSPSKFHKDITKVVLDAKIDVTAKDERGRTALHYALDRRLGEVTLELVVHLLSKGVDITSRDNTGCTPRDIAMFARRKDITAAIDKHYIQYVRNSDLKYLRKMLLSGYDDIFVEYLYRDTWIYAAGNETSDVTSFLNGVETRKNAGCEFHEVVVKGNMASVQQMLDLSEDSQLLLRYKDKGGRASLLLSILHGHIEVTKILLTRDPQLVHYDIDNSNRTVFHYAQSVKDESTRQDILSILTNKNNDNSSDTLDVMGFTPVVLVSKLPGFIAREKSKSFGMVLELHCLKKYECLLNIIRSKSRKLKHLNKVLKTVHHPVSEFPRLFDNLVTDYRDLLLCAIDHNKQDMALRLINIGVDCGVVEQYPVDDGSGKVAMNALQRARRKGMDDLVEYIAKKGINATTAKSECLVIDTDMEIDR